NGGIPVFITLEPPFDINWDEVKAKINSKTRLILINSPHNPTGKLFTQDDLLALADLVKNTKILLVSDEVYEHIIFDGQQHQSLMCNPILRERTFVCGSFGKTFHITGWKIGYC